MLTSDAFGRRRGDRRAGRPCASPRASCACYRPRSGQRIYKPGSVRGRNPATIIPLGLSLPKASSNQPGRRGRFLPCGLRPKASPRVAPIRSCSRWGLPCRSGYPSRGALLPHRFTHACDARRHSSAVCFLWHCPWGHPRRELPGTAFRGARTFLPRFLGGDRPIL